MASPQPVTENLAFRLKTVESPVRRTQQKDSKVVEFDPGRRASQRFGSLEAVPTELAGPEGFVYDGVRAGRAVRAGLSRRSAAVRPLPMEDVCLPTKFIDNSRCRRRVAPEEKRVVRHFVAAGFVVVALVLAAFGPRAALTRSGYRLGELSRQHQSLSEINHQLKMRQAMLSDVRRVTRFAEARGLAAPPADRYAWQNRTISPSSDSPELAHNGVNTQR